MNALCIIFLAVISQAFSLSLKERVNEDDYRKAMENEGLFQGDILGIDPFYKNAITSRSRLWPGGVVYYEIHSSLANVQGYIKAGMNHISEKTKGCITFVESRGSGSYIEIYNGNGCYSYVGRIGERQRLSLSGGCLHIGVVVHELCHALGLSHEQNRSDRDEYVKIHTENVHEDMLHNFWKLSAYENYLMTPYDYNSIMQYGPTSFSKNGKITIEPLQKGVTIKEPYAKSGLTDMDAFILQSLYSCPGYTRPPPKIPVDDKCDYENGFCGFKNEYGHPTAKLVSEGGNQYLRVDKHESHARLITRNYYNDGYTVCLTFRYKIEGSLKRDPTVVAYEGDVHQTSTFSRKDTNGWTSFEMQINYGSGFSAYMDIQTEETGLSAFGVDDVVLVYKPCK